MHARAARLGRAEAHLVGVRRRATQHDVAGLSQLCDAQVGLSCELERGDGARRVGAGAHGRRRAAHRGEERKYLLLQRDGVAEQDNREPCEQRCPSLRKQPAAAELLHARLGLLMGESVVHVLTWGLHIAMQHCGKKVAAGPATSRARAACVARQWCYTNEG